MMPLAHLPTLLLLIGYPLYWLELYAWSHSTGHTSWIATGLFAIAALVVICREKIVTRALDLPKWFLFTAAGLVGVIVCVAFAASLLPPHLPQEFDVINYHIMLPRQHLIVGSFAHLPWSSADLFLLPIDFALAPFWLATELPNKWPQFCFMLGAAAVAVSLTARWSNGRMAASVVAVTALFSLHSFGIQVGTGMLDIAICYLCFAAVDSFLSGNIWLAGVEFAFFFWSKPLMPAFMVMTLAGMTAFYFIFRIARGSVVFASHPWRKGVVYFLLASIFIAGPFMAKSMAVAGTPFYPMTKVVLSGDGCSPGHREVLSSVDQVSCIWKEIKDGYGHGRSLPAFIEHFWLIAVPEKGVNNSFDYPLGLIFLIFLFPFLLMFCQKFKDRKMPVLAVFVVVYWALWFFGSQQSRFLLIPLVGIFIFVAVEPGKPSRIFLGCILLALAMTAASVVRAHRPDFGRSAYSVLRVEDRALLERARTVRMGEVVEVSSPDVAFASFRVDVRSASNTFVIGCEH